MPRCSYRYLYLMIGFSIAAFNYGCYPSTYEQYKTFDERGEDRSLKNSIQTDLSQDSLTKSDPISVAIDRGIVQLSGFVKNPNVAKRAVHLALRTKGVKDVINSLIVRSSPGYKIERGLVK